MTEKEGFTNTASSTIQAQADAGHNSFSSWTDDELSLINEWDTIQ